MNNKLLRNAIYNSYFVVGSQLVSLLLGIAKALLLPILLGMVNFGYWQVYMFYLAYVGVLALGFNDGIYLKYGKYEYLDLPKEKLRSSIYLFILGQFLVTLLFLILVFMETDYNKQIALIWVAINIPIAGLTGVLVCVLQVTNQLKKFSFYTVIDKVIVLVTIVFVFLIKTDNYLIIIIADTISKVIVLVMLCITCKELIFGKRINLYIGYKELFNNISIGIKLMLANFSGMLVIGFGRFIVERYENIETYSSYSFAISTINLVLLFVAAVGLVLYPTLSRLEENRYPYYFRMLNEVITIATIFSLFAFFPIKVFVNEMFHQYNNIIQYLPVLFIILYIQTKMQVLINPYYKLLRKEKELLKANLSGFAIAAFLVSILYFSSNSVNMIAIGTAVAMYLRRYLSESFLRRILVVPNRKSTAVEIFMLLIFLLFSSQSNLLFGMLGYLISVIILILLKRKDITTVMKLVLRR